jgi:hypothetical protein
MKKFLYIALFSLALNTQAATLNNLKAPSNPNMAEFVEAHAKYQKEIDVLGNYCNLTTSVSYEKKSENESMLQIVKQALHRKVAQMGGELEEANVYESHKFSEYDYVISATGVESFDEEVVDQTYRKHRDNLEGLLISMHEEKKDQLQVFMGHQQGAETHGTFLALVNLEANELTIIGTSYCE